MVNVGAFTSQAQFILSYIAPAVTQVTGCQQNGESRIPLSDSVVCAL